MSQPNLKIFVPLPYLKASSDIIVVQIKLVRMCMTSIAPKIICLVAAVRELSLQNEM